jgi:hypothetical protein
MSIDEATRVVQEILNMQANNIITEEQALAAIMRVPHYTEILAI